MTDDLSDGLTIGGSETETPVPMWIREIREMINQGYPTWDHCSTSTQTRIADQYVREHDIGIGDIVPLGHDHYLWEALAHRPTGLLDAGASAAGFLLRGYLLAYVRVAMEERWELEVARHTRGLEDDATADNYWSGE